jgi:hypothetical protein
MSISVVASPRNQVGKNHSNLNWLRGFCFDVRMEPNNINDLTYPQAANLALQPSFGGCCVTHRRLPIIKIAIATQWRTSEMGNWQTCRFKNLFTLP